MTAWPDPGLRLALLAWRGAWRLLLPLVCLYLRRRAKADPEYGAHLPERFGRHAPWPEGPRTIWVHAVSLGEMRSAVPLIRALLARGDRVVTTHFTPAGRREAARVFAPEIAAGRLRAAWVPFETSGAFSGFFNTFRPALGLVMEVEIWPVMIARARRAGIPLLMCNAQYPSKSFARDMAGGRPNVRARLMRGFAGALVKSSRQAERFAAAGVAPIAVTGELRFAQPIPPAQIAAGRAARPVLAGDRPVLALCSVVEGEDALCIEAISEAIQDPSRPFFIYVPRAPERFGAVHALLVEAGLRVARRSDLFAADLTLRDAPECDVLLGDSLGEMYAYLAMADAALVGGGFTPKGAHNVIEPLAMGLPVLVGPEIWTIEYPAREAIAAGVVRHLETAEALAPAILEIMRAVRTPAQTLETQAKIRDFLAEHAGAVDKTLAAIDRLLPALTTR